MEKNFILAAALAVASTTAMADGFELASVKPNASTLGLGLAAEFTFNDKVGFTAGFNQYGMKADYEVDGISYAGELDLGSFGLTADYRPLGNGLKFSGGFRVNNNSASLHAEPTEDIVIGNQTYAAADVASLDGSISFDKIAPVATVGYSKVLGKGLTFGFEVGAMFHGEPNVSMEITGAAANDPDIAADLVAESENIESELAEFSIYPVAQVGFAWRF